VKSIAVLLIVLALVAGVAVNGSRAQPLSERSVAFEQCQVNSSVHVAKCYPFIGTLAQADPEDIPRDEDGFGDVVGIADVDPERIKSGWWVFAINVATYAAQWLVENRYFPGSQMPDSPVVATATLFDPVR
jgi:hypothetical protein